MYTGFMDKGDRQMIFKVAFEELATGRKLYQQVKAQTEQDAVTIVAREYPIFSITIRNVRKV